MGEKTGIMAVPTPRDMHKKIERKVAFYTLGCKVNQYDTEAVAEQFVRSGYQIVDFDELADVYVINTCTVTNIGDRKSRQIIRRAVRRNPDAVIVVMGCYAQVSPDEVASIEGVDLIVGTNDRQRIVDLVEEFLSTGEKLSFVQDIFATKEFEDIPITQFQGRTRATIKIQEGCNEFCSYCKIPYARGRSRSRRPDSVLAEVRRMEAAGFQEVVLTGIHLGAYGRDLEPGVELADLLELLCQKVQIPRIRISSIDPHEITPRFIEVMMRYPNLCRHLHVPLQGGHDDILKAMRRRYTLGEYRQVIEAVRQASEDIAITTDIIVGFPGETEEHFAASLRFVEEMEFSRLHVFPYSRRAGTPAAKMPGQVPNAVKQERARQMIELGRKLSGNFHARFIGYTKDVLLEQPFAHRDQLSPSLQDELTAIGESLNGPIELWEGLTDNYIRIIVPASEDMSGQLVEVELLAADSECMVGRITGRKVLS